VPRRLFAKSRIARRPESSRSVVGTGLLVLFSLGLVALSFFDAPYVIERPGPVVNVLGEYQDKAVIQITGTKTYPTEGELGLLSVSIVGSPEQTPSWPELFFAWIDPAQAIAPLEEFYPDTKTVEQVDAESTAMMEESQQDSVAIVLKKLGYEVPSNIYISEVSKNKPSSGKLVAGDFVVGINGVKPTSIDNLRAMIGEYDSTNPLKVSVLREGKSLVYEINPVKNDDGKYVLGILVGTKYDFPVKVNLQVSDIGGPSGGMMFALGIYDQLTPGALTGGKNIAGTGTVNAEGTVGPIGGIRQKMYGAQRSGATHFLAPIDNCSEVVGHIPTGLTVISVRNFEEALAAVETIARGSDLSRLGSCGTN
jgi:PDZ domain-containing protein